MTHSVNYTETRSILSDTRVCPTQHGFTTEVSALLYSYILL